MNFFRRIFKPRSFGSTYFYPVYYDAWRTGEYYRWYSSLPEVNAVVNLKVRAFSNMKLTGSTTADANIIRLIESPNWYQSGNEFIAQAKLQREVFGNEYLFILRPFGLQNIRAMYVLPSESMQVKQDESVPYFFRTEPVVRYVYKNQNSEVDLNREDVIHFASERKAGDLVGISPLDSLAIVCNNLQLAYESRGIILKYRGALGILVNRGADGVGNPFPIDPKERDRLQEEYRKYGLGADQHQIIISNQPMDWIQMSVNPDRLGLFDETKEALNKIVDKYGVPADLLTRQQGSTYENQRQAERGFYLRTILPEAAEWVAGLNTVFNTSMMPSFEHLTIFQDDLKIKNDYINSRVNTLSRLLTDGVITLEEYRSEVEKLIEL